MPRRRGITLIEVLVVIAIIGVLLTLILASIVRAREAALRSASMNNLREISHALQAFASVNSQRLPTLDGDQAFVSKSTAATRPAPPLFVAIYPYSEGAEATAIGVSKVYLSPADSTALDAAAKGLPVTSYAGNGQVFVHNPRLPTSFSDGTSNTIAFAEHYGGDCNGTQFYFGLRYSGLAGIPHRPSFADDSSSDIAPQTTPGLPPISTGLGRTFQVAPRISECAPQLAQTPHRSGMLAAMADGAVRSIAPNVEETVYWAAVTPSAGDIVRDW